MKEFYAISHLNNEIAFESEQCYAKKEFAIKEYCKNIDYQESMHKKEYPYECYLYKTDINGKVLNSNRKIVINKDQSIEETVCLTENNESVIEENKIITTKDVEFNLDKWKLGDKNILFITGLSGSGKSTKAAKLAKENNAVNIEIDLFGRNSIIFDKNTVNDEGNLVIKEYFEKKFGGARKFKQGDPQLPHMLYDFIKYCMNYASKHKDRLFILEGIQLADLEMTDELKGYPVIIVGTSMINSMYRAAKRVGIKDYLSSFKSYKDFVDWFKWYLQMDKDNKKFAKDLKESTIYESVNYKDVHPVYLVTSFTFTPLGKIISTVTNSKVSHSAISLDPNLDKMYTFTANTKELKGGLRVEDIKKYVEYNINSRIQVSVIFLKKKDYLKLKKFVDAIVENKHKFSYSYKGLFEVLFHKTDVKDYSMICSEFVSRVLYAINVDISNGKGLNLVSPKDIYELPKYNSKVYNLYNGLASTYDNKMITNRVKDMMKTSDYIKESTSFNESVRCIKLYHGSDRKFDILEPASIDLGNSFQKPGWSLFCWRSREKAFNWAAFRALLNYRKNNKIFKSMTEGAGSYWYPKYDKAMIIDSYLDIYIEEVKKANIYFYVYDLTTSISNLGLGNDSSHDEYTTKEEHIIPNKIAKYKLTENVIRNNFIILTKEEYDNVINNWEIHLNNRGLLSIFMINDFQYNFGTNTELIKFLYDAQKQGKLNPGDDISEFIDKNGKTINKLYPLKRFTRNNTIEFESTNYPEALDYLLETKEFPVDFDENGNLIIKNYKKLNFEAEYSSSHKLLKIYDDTNNIEGMKYELSKLWFMNNVLEKRIYSNPSEKDLIAYSKVRARILNDFNKYLKIVIGKEPSFNFTKYYEDSPFSDVKIKISGTLLSGLKDLLKQSL